MKTLKRTTAFALCAILLLSALLSCDRSGGNGNGNETTPPEGAVVSYKGLSITKPMYEYELAMQKSTLLYNYFGMFNQDVPELWTQKIDGGELGAIFLDSIVSNMKKTLYYASYAQENGSPLGETEERTIQSQLDTLYQRFGSQQAYEEFIGGYGITLDDVIAYTRIGMLYEQGNDMVYGYQGPKLISTEALQKYYDEKYITTRHIYINTVSKDDGTGSYVALSEEEVAAKKASAETIYAEATAEGADFAALAETYTEDTNAENWPDGFTFTSGTFGLAAYEEQTLGVMEIGQIKKFEVEGVGIFIVKRYELDQAMFDYFDYQIEEILINEGMQEDIEAAAADFAVDQKVIDETSMKDVPVVDLQKLYTDPGEETEQESETGVPGLPEGVEIIDSGSFEG